MVYKVSEVVKELGVSRQTVYKKLRRAVFKKYIVDLNGTIGVTEEGLQMLKSVQVKEIEERKYEQENKQDTTLNVTSLQKELLDSLNKQLKIYEEQLKVKDRQIEEKDKQINNLMQITENGQVLQKMILTNTEIKLLAYKEELEVRRNKAQEQAQKGIINKLKNIFNRAEIE